MNKINQPAVWEDSKGNLLLGNVEGESTFYYTVVFISATMKRRNYKKIPIGTKFLVNKNIISFPLCEAEKRDIQAHIKKEEEFISSGERLGTWHNPHQRIKEYTLKLNQFYEI